MTTLVYMQGATLPNAQIAVTDDHGNVADLTGMTLTLRVGNSKTLAFEKTSGLTYAAGVVTSDWADTGEISDLRPGKYQLDVIADDGTEHRTFSGSLTISGALPAV